MASSKEYFKNYYIKNRDKILEQRRKTKVVCKNCSKTFGQIRTNQKFCSRKCLGEFYRSKKCNSYVYRHIPEHPNANSIGNVREHRYIVEQHIGRYLKKTEVVHHINGNKRDNRIENLVVTNSYNHALHHYYERYNKMNSRGARLKGWNTRRKKS